MAVHTIFVPEGYSVEQVWQHIINGLPLNANTKVGVWVNVDHNGKLIEETK